MGAIKKSIKTNATPGSSDEAFLDSLLHGLNNPLTVLLNASREMDSMVKLGKVDKPSLGRHIEEIVQSSEEIETLARNVLVSSRIREGHGQAHYEIIPVADVFGSLRLGNAGKAARKRQELVFIEPEPEAALLSDRFFINTILCNLLDNAIKYSDFDTRIEVEWRPSDTGMNSILVSDQGPGICEKARNQLFMRFSPLSGRETGCETCQGLGLYVSRSLAILNGGSLELRPTGHGACFELMLPRCLPGKSKTPISGSS